MKQFGPFRLDRRNHALWRGSERIELAPRSFSMLNYFVENPRRLISHDELLDALWPNIYVQPEIIKTYIRTLRRALGDTHNPATYIETRIKLGYEFVASVANHDLAVSPVIETGFTDDDGCFDQGDITEQKILQAASIAGMVFCARSISIMLQVNHARALELCRGIVRPGGPVRTDGSASLADGTTSEKFRFVDPAIRAGHLASLSLSQRARLHRRLGRGAEQIMGDRVSEFSAQLGRRFEEGRDWPRASYYFRLAANDAYDRLATMEADEFIRRAAILAASPPTLSVA